MNDVFESLTEEFDIIQSRDPHFRGRRHVPDSYFYTDSYKDELENADDEYIEYDVFYDEKSKDEVMIEVVSLLDSYKEIYKVPTVRIGNREWDILFEEDAMVIYNESECQIFTTEGVEKYRGNFGKSVRLMLPAGGSYKYYLVTDNTIDTIQLK